MYTIVNNIIQKSMFILGSIKDILNLISACIVFIIITIIIKAFILKYILVILFHYECPISEFPHIELLAK